MLVPSISPPNLSLIGPLTTQIYYLTGITVTHRQAHRHTLETHTDSQTHSQTESDTLLKQEIGSSRKRNTKNKKYRQTERQAEKQKDRQTQRLVNCVHRKVSTEEKIQRKESMTEKDS